MTAESKTQVEELLSSDRDEVVEVLAAAFQDYPIMRFMLGQECPDYEAQLRALLGFYTDKRFARRWPVLGLRIKGKLAAIGLVSEPSDEPPPEPQGKHRREAKDEPDPAARDVRPDRAAEAVTRLEVRLRAEIGDAAYYRMERFERASDEMEPPEPHHFIGMLAVHPEHQGNGYATVIVDRVKEISKSAESAGICLTTEDAANLPMYEHLGFFVIGETDLDDVHSWCLLWGNRAFGNDEAERGLDDGLI